MDDGNQTNKQENRQAIILETSQDQDIPASRMSTFCNGPKTTSSVEESSAERFNSNADPKKTQLDLGRDEHCGLPNTEDAEIVPLTAKHTVKFCASTTSTAQASSDAGAFSGKKPASEAANSILRPSQRPNMVTEIPSQRQSISKLLLDNDRFGETIVHL